MEPKTNFFWEDEIGRRIDPSIWDSITPKLKDPSLKAEIKYADGTGSITHKETFGGDGYHRSSGDNNWLNKEFNQNHLEGTGLMQQLKKANIHEYKPSKGLNPEELQILIEKLMRSQSGYPSTDQGSFGTDPFVWEETGKIKKIKRIKLWIKK